MGIRRPPSASTAAAWGSWAGIPFRLDLWTMVFSGFCLCSSVPIVVLQFFNFKSIGNGPDNLYVALAIYIIENFPAPLLALIISAINIRKYRKKYLRPRNVAISTFILSLVWVISLAFWVATQNQTAILGVSSTDSVTVAGAVNWPLSIVRFIAGLVACIITLIYCIMAIVTARQVNPRAASTKDADKASEMAEFDLENASSHCTSTIAAGKQQVGVVVAPREDFTGHTLSGLDNNAEAQLTMPCAMMRVQQAKAELPDACFCAHCSSDAPGTVGW